METLIITSIGKLPRETITYYELTYGVMINDCGCCGYEVSGEQDRLRQCDASRARRLLNVK